MIMIISTLLVGSVLGIVGVVSKDAISILKYVKSSENLMAFGTLTIPDKWFRIDEDGYVVNTGIYLDINENIGYKAIRFISCNDCGYESNKDEFEE